MAAARFVEGFAAFDGDFFHGFDAVADEGGADDVEGFDALFGQLAEHVFGGRFEPFAAAEAALEGGGVFVVGEAEGGGEQAGGFAAFVGIGVARVGVRLRDAVEAHQQVFAFAVFLPVGGDLAAQGFDVAGVVVKAAQGAQGGLAAGAQHGAGDGVEGGAAAGCGVLREEGEGEDFVDALGFEFGDGVGGVGQAVGHGAADDGFGQAFGQGFGLALAVDHQRRAFFEPDFFVVGGTFFGTEGEDEAAQDGLPEERRQFDDAGVGEELAQVGAHGFGGGGGGGAEVDEEDAGFAGVRFGGGGFCLVAFHGFPSGGVLTGFSDGLFGAASEVTALMSGAEASFSGASAGAV